MSGSDTERLFDERPWCCNEPMVVKLEFVYGRDYVCARCGRTIEENDN